MKDNYKRNQIVGAFSITVLIMVLLYAIYVICAPKAEANYGSANVEVFWTGTPCIEVMVATGQTQTVCGGYHNFYNHNAVPGITTGVDPIMGSATSISCTFFLNGYVEYFDYAERGDGTDVNCLRAIVRKDRWTGLYAA